MVLIAAQHRPRVLRLIAGAICLPLAFASVYLWFSRWPARTFSTNSDYIALAASICLGMLFVIVLPFRARVRALLVAAYAPLAFVVLVVYSLLFVGFAFGDWL